MQAFTFHRRSFDSNNVLESNFAPLSPDGNRLRGLALIPRSTAPLVTAARDGPNNLLGPFGLPGFGPSPQGFGARPRGFGPSPREFGPSPRGQELTPATRHRLYHEGVQFAKNKFGPK